MFDLRMNKHTHEHRCILPVDDTLWPPSVLTDICLFGGSVSITAPVRLALHCKPNGQFQAHDEEQDKQANGRKHTGLKEFPCQLIIAPLMRFPSNLWDSRAQLKKGTGLPIQ